jgi:hypothetical protein
MSLENKSMKRKGNKRRKREELKSFMSLLSLIIAIISASCFDWSAFLVNLFGHFVLSLSPCLFLFILLQVKASFSGVKQMYLMFN